MHMRTLQFAFMLALLSCVNVVVQARDDDNKAASGEKGHGTVCVLPNSSEPPRLISPGGEYNPATLKVRIDKSQPILWPHKQLVRIENLSLDERHLVVLTSDGKRIQSLWFRFTDYKDVKLCLYFDGYQGVQLADRSSARWCRCK